MGFVLLVVLVALVLGGIGLLVEGLFWLFVIGLVLLLAGVVSGALSRGRSG